MFASSAVKLKPSDIDDFLRAVTCPLLNIWASDGIKAARPKMQAMERRATEITPNYITRELPGDHHFHMHTDTAQQIATMVSKFLKASLSN